MDANILAVDTSSRVLSIAIRTGNGTLFESNLEGTPRHSEQIIDLIQSGLARLGLKKNELDLFLWGLGPGSFTGLRIGLSVLKGFHLGFEKHSFGASSLDLVALGSGMVKGELAVCIDARREHIYAALYRFQGGKAKKVFQDSLVSFETFMKKVSRDTVFTGDALVPYGGWIQKKLGENTLFLSPSFWYPRALFLTHLYEAKREWLKPLTLRTMTPQYLRISEAEEKLKQRRKH